MGDRILQRGMQGHDVRVLQDYLGILGYHSPITGYFGSRTKLNLEAFQRAHHLTANGILIYSVSQKLRSAVAAKLKSERPGKGTISHGLAVPPANAPAVIRKVIAAANKIAFKPYVYGGGHGNWNSYGYDCSGSVSYALHGGGLLSSPEDSSQFESYGSAGRGRWITIWTNPGHAYMYVAGLRFDTSAQSQTGGSRWTSAGRSSSGFIARHPRGL
jgi:cell wall-associated NlpC family hydrolase